MKKGFYLHLSQEASKSDDYRRVLYTSNNVQLVVMSLQPNQEIGSESHDLDQFIQFVSGQGKVVINESMYNVKDGDAVIIPAHCEHNVINVSESDKLKLFTLYSPPEHKDGTIHETKEDEEEEHFDGKTSE